MTKITPPPGYIEDADGNLVPMSKIKEIDCDRSNVVTDLCRAALNAQATLVAFKLNAVDDVNSFIERSLEKYSVKYGRGKGNVTLTSFDGRYKIVRQSQDSITFDERLIAAKTLIDECIIQWSKGSNLNMRVLVNDAFQVDKTGKISTSRILGLRRIKIEDEKWARAMDAIGDSIQVVKTKSYIRFYERDENSGEYMPIVLDVAGL
jgi:hypothetical protein